MFGIFIIVLYALSCAILGIIFYFFKKKIFSTLWLGAPFLFASIILLPVFLIVFGYFLRIFDEKREERLKERWYDEDSEYESELSLKVGK
ncbi:MAG TPA: hypothetical protein ENI51_07830 [Candidatus Atribacteria bacterium]|nr:hypothetical protein [Candidatus Atribacteria bacterium]